jgi:hypothetical protein
MVSLLARRASTRARRAEAAPIPTTIMRVPQTADKARPQGRGLLRKIRVHGAFWLFPELKPCRSQAPMRFDALQPQILPSWQEHQVGLP